jgi:hypothetical protein
MQTFSFVFRNPPSRNRQDCGGADPQACKSIFEPTLAIKYTPLSKFVFAPVLLNGDVLGAGEDPVMRSASVTEEHNVQGVSNLLTFSLQANMPLPPGTTIVVSGMTQTTKPSADDVVLHAPSGVTIEGVPLAKCFAENGVFERAKFDDASATLTMTVSSQCTIPSSYMLRIGAVLRNPAAAQTAPVLTVSISHAGCSQCVVLCSCTLGDRQPFAIPPVQVSGSVLAATSPLSLSTRLVILLPGFVLVATMHSMFSLRCCPHTLPERDKMFVGACACACARACACVRARVCVCALRS